MNSTHHSLVENLLESEIRIRFNKLNPILKKILSDLDKQGLTHKTFLYSICYLLNGWIEKHLNARKIDKFGQFRVKPLESYKNWINRLQEEIQSLENRINSTINTPYKSRTFNNGATLKSIHDYKFVYETINSFLKILQPTYLPLKQEIKL